MCHDQWLEGANDFIVHVMYQNAEYSTCTVRHVHQMDISANINKIGN